jgi:universal stress protein A
MNDYRHILVAVDFSPDNEQIIRRAKRLAEHSGARLSLIHVVEPVGLAYAGEIPFPENFDLEQHLSEQAELRMEGFRQQNEVPEARYHVEVGSPKHEIIRIAEEQGVDLIVLGSHGRRGLQLLLGATANGVLHMAECDVLAVRVR